MSRLIREISSRAVSWHIKSIWYGLLWRYRLNLKSKEKLFEKLGLEFMQHKWRYKKLRPFYNILKEQPLKYLFNKLTRPYPTRNASNIHHFKVKHSFFKKKFSVRHHWMEQTGPSSIKVINWNTSSIKVNPPTHVCVQRN